MNLLKSKLKKEESITAKYIDTRKEKEIKENFCENVYGCKNGMIDIKFRVSKLEIDIGLT